jgi:hypothetical protein
MASTGQVAGRLSYESRGIAWMAIFAVCAATLAACFPVSLSIAAVVLFAGPHNWMEARYFVARMPVHWGRQRTFFLVAIAGVIALSATFSIIAVHRSIWHTAAALWTLSLIRTVRRDVFAAALPLAFLWMALAWAAPGWIDLSLVFLHPIAALWFVRRQIARTRPEWLPGFHGVLAAIVPLALIILFFNGGMDRVLASAPISFAQLSLPPPLLALHAFLELLHYGAWVILLPFIGLAAAPWDFRRVPLVGHRDGWPGLVKIAFSAGAAAVVVLWISFLADYKTTREIYFTLAIVHVMAEVPFLAWLR